MPDPVYDTDLEKLVKNKEAATGLAAPFGEETLEAATVGVHWNSIGEAWGGRSGKSAMVAWRTRNPSDDHRAGFRGLVGKIAEALDD